MKIAYDTVTQRFAARYLIFYGRETYQINYNFAHH